MSLFGKVDEIFVPKADLQAMMAMMNKKDKKEPSLKLIEVDIKLIHVEDDKSDRIEDADDDDLSDNEEIISLGDKVIIVYKNCYTF